MISIVIPTLNDNDALLTLLTVFQPVRTESHEIIVVSGGVSELPETIVDLTDVCLTSKAGRAMQMNLGADHASGEIIWFLHADSQFSVDECLAGILSLSEGNLIWGRFDIRLSSEDWRFRVIEKMMNMRSRLTGIATGDQGVFVERKVFQKIGGYNDIALMEDVQLSKDLKKISAPLLLKQRITTSSRRWQKNGMFRTVLLMWFLRFAYFIGISPLKLSKFYKTCN